MVDVSSVRIDPTLDAMNDAIAVVKNREKRRLYLGMSGLGRPCAREQWYNFHWAMHVEFDAKTLKNFEDGHRTEDLYAARLRMVPGVTLITSDPTTGRQIKFTDLGGHFMGHMDGEITGIYQAPVTPHVWEHKAVNETKFDKLKDLCDELGEKRALKEWDGTYHSQGILYMEYGGYTRHYLTCSTPGGRDDTSVRTDANPKEAQRLKDVAERIIFLPQPPDKIGAADFYLCRWCAFSDVCHEGAAAERNCRTCMWSTPRREGGWICEFYNAQLSPEAQAEGCTSHRYNPHLIPGEVIGGNAEENWVLYRMPNGTEWKDEGR